MAALVPIALSALIPLVAPAVPTPVEVRALVDFVHANLALRPHMCYQQRLGAIGAIRCLILNLPTEFYLALR